MKYHATALFTCEYVPDLEGLYLGVTRAPASGGLNGLVCGMLLYLLGRPV